MTLSRLLMATAFSPAGLGAHYGVERLGASVVPMSGGNTARQLMLMQDFGTTILACTPSYALFLAEEGIAAGVDFKKLPLRAGVFGAEPWTENMRKPAGVKNGYHRSGYLRTQ